MLLIRTLGPAAALVFAAGLYAQTTPGPTTGGTAPPGGPTTGGTAPASRPMVIFPTDPTQPTAGGVGTAATPTMTRATPTATFPNLAIQSPGVPGAMNLTDRQQAQLTTFTQQLQSRFQPQYDRLSGLPVAEQANRLEQLNREFTAAWLDGARGVLTPDQLTRAQQLQLQFGGFASLTDPVVQKALNLTDAQRAALRQDLTWSQQQQAAIQQAALTDQARALQMFNTFNTNAQTRLSQLLNTNQQQAWAQMVGTPFAFQPTFPTGTTGTAGTTTPSGIIAVPSRVTGPGGAPVRSGTPAGAAPAPAPPPGAPGPTTGGTAQPGGPTTGGTAPPSGPTTGGTVPPSGPTTGGTAPGGMSPGTPPKM
jgi:hypothetical protein